MRTMNKGEVGEVSGGLIGGGTSRRIPMADSRSTREAGQNSYGETIPGGLVFYENAMSLANLQTLGDSMLANQVNSCTTGNLLVCALDTLQVVNNQLEQASRRAP